MNPDHPSRRQLLALLQSLFDEMDGEWEADFAHFDDLADKPGIAVAMQAGDVDMVLVHSLDPETSRLMLLECRFGRVPASDEARAFARVLDLNYQISPHNTTGFAIDEATGDVIYTYPCAIEGMTARDLYGLMSGIAELALLWRGNYFLGAEGDAAVEKQLMRPGASA